MSIPNDPAEDSTPDGEAAPAEQLDAEEYGSLSIEDDPDGTVDPGELAGGAGDDDEDVS